MLSWNTGFFYKLPTIPLQDWHNLANVKSVNKTCAFAELMLALSVKACVVCLLVTRGRFEPRTPHFLESGANIVLLCQSAKQAFFVNNPYYGKPVLSFPCIFCSFCSFIGSWCVPGLLLKCLYYLTIYDAVVEHRAWLAGSEDSQITQCGFKSATKVQIHVYGERSEHIWGVFVELVRTRGHSQLLGMPLADTRGRECPPALVHVVLVTLVMAVIEWT